MPNSNTVNEKLCRICLETEHQEKMVSPCHCIGSIAYVHSYCEEMWIEKSPTSITHGQPSYILCQLCHEKIYFQEKKIGCLRFLQKSSIGVVFCFVIFCIVLMGEVGATIYILLQIVESEQYAIIFFLIIFAGVIIIITSMLLKTFYDTKIKKKLKAYKIIDRRQRSRAENQSNKNLDQIYVEL